MFRARNLVIVAAMLLYVLGTPAFARGLCEGEQQAKSPDGTAPTTIYYTNDGTSEELWVWLDQQGNRQLFKTLKPGDLVRQPTFVGHIWIVLNKGEDCELMIRAEKGDVFKTVYEDVAAAKIEFAKRVGLPDAYVATWAKNTASCGRVDDQLAVSATGYASGKTMCRFVEGPIGMEGGFQGIADCGGQKHDIRMTLSSGLLTVQGTGVPLDNLTRCGSAAMQTTGDSGQECTQAVNDDTVHPYEPALHTAFAAAFGDAKGPPPEDDLKTGAYRCMDSHLVGCLVGANLPCFKMDASPQNKGADAFCQGNANSDSVPLVASGHGSIYEYKCVGNRAEIKDTMYQLDKRGFARDLWKTLN